MLVDISDIKKDLNEEEKEIFDKVIKAMNAKSVTISMLNLAFLTIANKLITNDKDIYKKILSIRLKIANLEK